MTDQRSLNSPLRHPWWRGRKLFPVHQRVTAYFSTVDDPDRCTWIVGVVVWLELSIVEADHLRRARSGGEFSSGTGESAEMLISETGELEDNSSRESALEIDSIGEMGSGATGCVRGSSSILSDSDAAANAASSLPGSVDDTT